MEHRYQVTPICLIGKRLESDQFFLHFLRASDVEFANSFDNTSFYQLNRLTSLLRSYDLNRFSKPPFRINGGSFALDIDSLSIDQ